MTIGPRGVAVFSCLMTLILACLLKSQLSKPIVQQNQGTVVPRCRMLPPLLPWRNQLAAGPCPRQLGKRCFQAQTQLDNYVCNLHCSWHVFWFFSFLVLFIFTGGLQKTKLFATIPRVEMQWFQPSSQIALTLDRVHISPLSMTRVRVR